MGDDNRLAYTDHRAVGVNQLIPIGYLLKCEVMATLKLPSILVRKKFDMDSPHAIAEHIEYQYHGEHDIHEYKFFKSSQAVSAAWFEHLEQIVKSAIEAEATEIRIIVDVTDGGNRQPVGYMFNRAKALAANNPNAPLRRYAVIGSSSAVGAILSPFMSILRLKFRYFMESQRAQAIAWLNNS